VTNRVTERSAAAPIHLRVPAEPASLATIRIAVSAAATAAGMPRDRVEDVLVAVTEACTNVIVHAYEGRPGMVDVRMAERGGVLDIIVRDHGRGLVPRLRHTSPGLRLGLQMIAALADEVRFSTPEGGGTTVRMGFLLP